MSGFIRRIGIVRLALLSVLLSSIMYSALFLLYALTDAPEASYEVSSTVRGERVVLTLFSQSILHAGEDAKFYIDITNEREEYIHRIDFVLTTRAASLFNIKVFSTTGYSDRGYWRGVPERLVIEDRLPPFTLPGIYELELVARPQGLAPLPPARVVTYVQAPLSTLLYPLVLTAIFGAVYVLLYTMAGSRALMHLCNLVSRILNELFGKCVFFPLLETQKRSEEAVASVKKAALEKTRLVGQVAEEKFEAYLATLSIGQRFVFLGISFLSLTALTVVAGLEAPAEDLAVLAYLSLVVGILNLFWEYIREPRPGEAGGSPLRATFSVFIYAVFVYLSTARTIPFKVLGMLTGALSVYLHTHHLSSFTK